MKSVDITTSHCRVAIFSAVKVRYYSNLLSEEMKGVDISISLILDLFGSVLTIAVTLNLLSKEMKSVDIFTSIWHVAMFLPVKVPRRKIATSRLTENLFFW